MKHGIRNLAIAAGLFGALAMGATACKEAQAKTQGVGDEFRPFIIKNCGTGERYCQVCAYGGKPTIMAVYDIDDAGAEKDLAEIEKVIGANKDKGLTAFALFGKLSGGKFTPIAADGPEEKKLAEIRTKLNLSYPVTLVPKDLTDKESKSYMPFTKLYEVNKSRRVLLAGGDNKIVYADTMTGDAKQYEALAAAVKAKL